MPLFFAVFALAIGAAGCGGPDATPATAEVGGAAGGPSNGGSPSSGGGGSAGGEGGEGGEAGSAPLPDAGGGAPSACSLPPVAPGTAKRSLQSSGESREVLLHVPPSYDASAAVPLLLVFHGYFGTAQGMESVTGLSSLADQKGFAVAYGVGLGQSWNAGKCCGSSSSLDRPDVQYVSDVIDHVSAELCIDSKRVYATGMSNGGMLSNRLGCELAQRIAAIAPVAGPRAISQCQPARPLPVIAFHGTGDAIVPYYGGGSGGAEPVLDSFAFWSKNASCTDTAPSQVFHNGSVSCVERAACAGGARQRLCTIEGGGHQWPGGVALPFFGAQTTDIDASAALLDFLLAQTLP
jgi:polyhydroxybutyrate depolymerase